MCEVTSHHTNADEILGGGQRAYLSSPTHEVTYHLAPYITIVIILPAHLVKSNSIQHMVRGKVDMKIMGMCAQDIYLVHTRKEKKQNNHFSGLQGLCNKICVMVFYSVYKSVVKAVVVHLASNPKSIRKTK